MVINSSIFQFSVISTQYMCYDYFTKVLKLHVESLAESDVGDLLIKLLN